MEKVRNFVEIYESSLIIEKKKGDRILKSSQFDLPLKGEEKLPFIVSANLDPYIVLWSRESNRLVLIKPITDKKYSDQELKFLKTILYNPNFYEHYIGSYLNLDDLKLKQKIIGVESNPYEPNIVYILTTKQLVKVKIEPFGVISSFDFQEDTEDRFIINISLNGLVHMFMSTINRSGDFYVDPNFTKETSLPFTTFPSSQFVFDRNILMFHPQNDQYSPLDFYDLDRGKYLDTPTELLDKTLIGNLEEEQEDSDYVLLPNQVANNTFVIKDGSVYILTEYKRGYGNPKVDRLDLVGDKLVVTSLDPTRPIGNPDYSQFIFDNSKITELTVGGSSTNVFLDKDNNNMIKGQKTVYSVSPLNSAFHNYPRLKILTQGLGRDATLHVAKNLLPKWSEAQIWNYLALMKTLFKTKEELWTALHNIYYA